MHAGQASYQLNGIPFSRKQTLVVNSDSWCSHGKSQGQKTKLPRHPLICQQVQEALVILHHPLSTQCRVGSQKVLSHCLLLLAPNPRKEGIIKEMPRSFWLLKATGLGPWHMSAGKSSSAFFLSNDPIQGIAPVSTSAVAGWGCLLSHHHLPSEDHLNPSKCIQPSDTET